MVLGKVIGDKKELLTGDGTKLLDQKPHDLYSTGAGTSHTGEKRNAYGTLDEEPETYSPLQNFETRNRAVEP